MFSDPQSVTINAVANSLPRVSTGVNLGSYSKDDGLVKLRIQHSYAKKAARRLVRLEHAKIAADPFLAGVNNRYGMAVHMVVEVPETGYTVAEAKQVVDGFIAYLSASSGAAITRVLGGES